LSTDAFNEAHVELLSEVAEPIIFYQEVEVKFWLLTCLLSKQLNQNCLNL